MTSLPAAAAGCRLPLGEIPVRLSEILNSKTGRLITLTPTASVLRAAILMKTGGVGAVVVCDHRGRVLGVVSERDLVLAMAAMGPDVFELCVGQVMTVDVPTARPHMAIQNVMRIMMEQRARHLPVVEDGVAVGVVSIGDVLKSRLAEKIQENAVLQDLARARLPA
jgi:CBS domain-containing protein